MPGPSPVRPVGRSARLRGRWAALRARAHREFERLFSSRVPWILLFFGAVAPLTLGPRLTPEPPVLPPGPVAPTDITASEAREFVDEAATQRGREAARQSVRPIYDVDGHAFEDAARSLQDTLDAWRAASGPAPRVA